jgi:integrase
MRLNDRIVATLTATENKQTTYLDDALPGFGVRVGARAKAFVLTVGKERRRITLGRYPGISLAQARQKARTIIAQRQLGLDHQPPPTPLFKEMLRDYLASRDHAVRYSTRLKDGYVSKRFESLAERQLTDIGPDVVQRILDAQDASWTRHYCLRMFASFLKFAQKRGYMEQWPIHRLDAPLVVISRERVLTDDELRRVLLTARIWAEAGHQFGIIVELLILTGERRQQIGSLDRAHVDFDADTLTWPADLMKNNRRHAIPMGKMVREILEPHSANGLYFPNMYGYPFSAWSVWYKRFTKDLGFDDFVLHDLRRTLATRWQEIGVEIATTEKMLSHSTITGGLVGVYQRSSYLAQMRAAVQKWEEHIQALLSTPEGTNGRDVPRLHSSRP